MSAEETLKLIAKQWCTIEDIMRLGHLGRNSALKAKKKIKDKLEKQGYPIPKSVVPTKKKSTMASMINGLSSENTNH